MNFRLDPATSDFQDDPAAPPESIRGFTRLRLTDSWSLSYSATRDLDENVTRNQKLGLGFRDDCTEVELFFTRRNFDSDVIRDSTGFGIRLSLLTLGEFGGDVGGERQTF